ncbi:MAG TPA: TolC family outer membrane protein [Phenylobacterium sp.]|nr:TolC family outer membrane protein [Phenylobacterium sp.]
MTKSLRGRLLAAVFSAGLAGAFAAPACAETLSDAIALAYETNPTLQAQRASQRALDETYVQARTGWRPTLTLSPQVLYTDVRTPRAATSFFSPATRSHSNIGDLVITFTQPIWTGGRTASAVSAAEGDVLQGRENLRRVEGQLLAAVVQAYEDVRRDQQSLEIRVEDVGVLQKQLDEARARFDVGEVTRTDVAQAEAQLAAVQAQQENARAQLAISRANYAVLVGQNPGDLAPEPSLATLLPGNVDDAFAVAEKYNPTLRGQEFAEAASRARIAQARAERMPRLDLEIQPIYGNAPLDPFNQGLFSRSITSTVTLTVPLFTGGLTTSRIRQSIEQNNSDRITIETQRRAVLQSVTQSWSQLTAARANITSDTQQERAAQIAAEGTKQELDVGLRTTIDVLNADIVLRSAQLGLIAARHDEYVAAAQLLLSMGRLEARNLIPSAPQYDPAHNLRRLRITWGWVPWEEPISIVDKAIAFPVIPQAKPLPEERQIGPGLQPPPAPQVVAAPKR